MYFMANVLSEMLGVTVKFESPALPHASYHEAILLFGGMKTAGDRGSLLTFS
jgi:hypothetical protein